MLPVLSRLSPELCLLKAGLLAPIGPKSLVGDSGTSGWLMASTLGRLEPIGPKSVPIPRIPKVEVLALLSGKREPLKH